MIILKTYKFELKKKDAIKKNYNTLVTISQLFKKFSLEPHVVLYRIRSYFSLFLMVFQNKIGLNHPQKQLQIKYNIFI